MSPRPSLATDLVALALGLAALGGSFAALEAARRKAEPRRAIAASIRREASRRDLVVVVDDAPELLALVRPVPALLGAPPLGDLTGLRRLYALAPAEPMLAPFYARLGPAAPFGGSATARRWDVADGGLARVVFNAADALGTQVQARREGGGPDFEGDCPATEGRLTCRGPGWFHVAAQPLHFEGVELRCVFAHPHPAGRLVLELTSLPPARAVVGVVGIDDAGFFPNGAPVTLHVEYRAEQSPPVARDVVAPNRRGVTPWRIDVPAKPASATLTVSAPDAAARQFCFTFTATG